MERLGALKEVIASGPWVRAVCRAVRRNPGRSSNRKVVASMKRELTSVAELWRRHTPARTQPLRDAGDFNKVIMHWTFNV